MMNLAWLAAFTLLSLTYLGSSPARGGAAGHGGSGASRPAASAARPVCHNQLFLSCPDQFVDGCLDGRTSEHVCVARTATPGPVCEAEIALLCPDGQVDACSFRPAVTTHHICALAR